jgi:hypothetical protein
LPVCLNQQHWAQYRSTHSQVLLANEETGRLHELCGRLLG